MHITGDDAPAGGSPAENPENTPVQEEQNPSTEGTVDAEGENGSEPRVFTQEELNEIVQKRVAKERVATERRIMAEIEQRKIVEAPIDDLFIEYFDSPEDYAEAYALRKQEIAENAKKHAELVATALVPFFEQEEEAKEKYEDYEAVTRADDLKISDTMFDAITRVSNGPDVAYHLGKNKELSAEIAGLKSVAEQVFKIRELSDKLKTSPDAQKPHSKAPDPVTPVSGRSTGAKVIDTTDPRSVEHLSTAEWIAAENARELKKKGLL